MFEAVEVVLVGKEKKDRVLSKEERRIVSYHEVGHALISALQDVKYSYNSYTMNAPSIILGTEAVKDEAYFRETVEKIVRTREAAKERFRKMGFSCTDSKTNFLFVSHEKVSAKEIFENLKGAGIYVRYFCRSQAGESPADHHRDR